MCFRRLIQDLMPDIEIRSKYLKCILSQYCMAANFNCSRKNLYRVQSNNHCYQYKSKQFPKALNKIRSCKFIKQRNCMHKRQCKAVQELMVNINMMHYKYSKYMKSLKYNSIHSISSKFKQCLYPYYMRRVQRHTNHYQNMQPQLHIDIYIMKSSKFDQGCINNLTSNYLIKDSRINQNCKQQCYQAILNTNL